MPRTYWFFLFLLLSTPDWSQAQYSVFPNLNGEALTQKLVQQFKPGRIFNYGRARDTLFRVIDSVNDSLECVYTGYTILLGPGDPTTVAYQQQINTEHSYPKSKGAKVGNGESDMHHLFPTRVDVNAARSSQPFGDLAPTQVERWYRLDQHQSDTPLKPSAYSAWASGQAFEPRDAIKGDIARAIFYFYTMYYPETQEYDPEFFPLMRAALCRWHEQDPVDNKELQRTWAIASYQEGRPNPFVLDCTLPRRTYCSELPATGCSMTLDLTGLPSEATALIRTTGPSNYEKPSNRPLTPTVLDTKTVNFGPFVIKAQKLRLERGKRIFELSLYISDTPLGGIQLQSDGALFVNKQQEQPKK